MRVVRVLSTARIGERYGFSGRIHRVVVEMDSGRTLSHVVKEESIEAVERELLARRELGEGAHGAIPHCYAGAVDRESGRGALVLEDVDPATQGDVLGGCTWDGAEAAVCALARLHALTLRGTDDFPADLPRWRGRAMDAEQWRDRLAHAHSRFPDTLTPELVARLHALPEAVETALVRLKDGPAAWIHCDAHLDNVLWRSDGSAVFLDWCNAAIGPPAVDLAGLLNDGVEPRWRPALTAAYANEIERRSGRPAALEIEPAVTHLLQAMIGWAGREDFPETGRPMVACRSALRSVLRWADLSGLQ